MSSAFVASRLATNIAAAYNAADKNEEDTFYERRNKQLILLRLFTGLRKADVEQFLGIPVNRRLWEMAESGASYGDRPQPGRPPKRSKLELHEQWAAVSYPTSVG